MLRLENVLKIVTSYHLKRVLSLFMLKMRTG